MQLSRNLRTDVIILRDGTRIPVTKDQYSWALFIKEDWKPTNMIRIIDIDTWKKLFHWEARDIKGFEEITRKDTSGMQWICSYGSHHKIHDECNCFPIFKMQPVIFRAKAYELFWKSNEETENYQWKTVYKRFYDPIYMQDLTKEQKLQIIK